MSEVSVLRRIIVMGQDVKCSEGLVNGKRVLQVRSSVLTMGWTCSVFGSVRNRSDALGCLEKDY